MSLDELTEDVNDRYGDLGTELPVSLDRETRNELAMLTVALEPDGTDELLRRAVHMLFQSTVETGGLDFHLRSGYDVTYDEYLSGVTYEEMTTTPSPGASEEQRRYQY